MSLAPYTGLVATRCLAPISRNGTNKQLMARSPHYARTAITSLQIIIPNWYINPASTHAEIGAGLNASVTASIEYPSGTFTQILFSGVATGTVVDVSQLLSDSVTVTIPDGALFWVRIFWDCTGAAGGVLTVAHDLTGGSNPGSGLEVAVSGLTDKTMSGTVTAGDNEFSPVAIIGTTTQRSVVIVGDSLALGDSTKELTGDATGDFGVVARSIGPLYAYASYCQNGDQGEDFVAMHTNRGALFAYASDLICEYGSNDLFTVGASAATVLATLQSIWGVMTGLGAEKKAYQTTITPRSTSTDSWATTVNQTKVDATIDARRVSLNSTLRGIPTGLNGCLDVASAVESAFESGLWKATGAANFYTADGIHPSTDGSIAIRDSGVVAFLAGEDGTGVMTPAAGPVGWPQSGSGGGAMTPAAGPR